MLLSTLERWTTGGLDFAFGTRKRKGGRFRGGGTGPFLTELNFGSKAMNLRKLCSALAMAGALSIPAAANAILIDGIVIQPGALFEFALLAEAEKEGSGNNNGIIDQPGEILVGIGKVIEITDGGGGVLWSDTDNNRELTFYFEYTAENFSTDGTNEIIGFTGGAITVYSGPSNVPGLRFERNGSQADDITRATDGSVWLTLTGSPIGNAVTPEYGTTSGNPITLRSIGTSLTSGTVDGRGNTDVTGGAAAAYLDTNQFTCTSDPLADPPGPCPDLADKVFTTSGQLVALADYKGWGFLGTGELRDNAVAVPEPSALALLGLGLAGLGYRARRDLKKG